MRSVCGKAGWGGFGVYGAVFNALNSMMVVSEYYTVLYCITHVCMK